MIRSSGKNLPEIKAVVGGEVSGCVEGEFYLEGSQKGFEILLRVEYVTLGARDDYEDVYLLVKN